METKKETIAPGKEFHAGRKEEVNHPPHYNKGDQEVIEIISDQCHPVDGYRGFLMGNVLKYVCRHPHKGTELVDLQKAEWYLKKLIDTYGHREAA